ncbi:histidine phosphatase family protein [Marinobacterium aestuariivivens]|uniref:Histidine phosphatase family protein n=1 Tax=Marinobacterium aestuariivivens TaxID=1698799 RepID=A0ABW1ZZ99_9GAMM
MAIIHLVRHGETEWNLQGRMQGQLNSPLTELGKRQATQLGDKLAQYSFDHALCSSSGRTQQTAKMILEGRVIPLQTRDELREIGLGAWEGQAKQDIKRRDPENYWHFWHRPDLYRRTEGGESFSEFMSRVSQAFNNIVRQYQGQEILVVTHMVFIKALLTLQSGRTLSRLWLPPQVDNCCHWMVRKQVPGRYALTDMGALSRAEAGTAG